MKNDLAEAQLQTLQERLQDHHLEAMMLLAFVLGLRRDEMRGLTWSKVDLETDEMHVLSSKTKSHVRHIHLPENVVSVLKQYALHQEESRDAATVKQRSDLVFPDGTGGELSIQRFLQEWHACCEYAGLPPHRFHDLRVHVWRRLCAQERETPEGCDRTKDDLNKHTNGEESDYGHS